MKKRVCFDETDVAVLESSKKVAASRIADYRKFASEGDKYGTEDRAFFWRGSELAWTCARDVIAEALESIERGVPFDLKKRSREATREIVSNPRDAEIVKKWGAVYEPFEEFCATALNLSLALGLIYAGL